MRRRILGPFGGCLDRVGCSPLVVVGERLNLDPGPVTERLYEGLWSAALALRTGAFPPGPTGMRLHRILRAVDWHAVNLLWPSKKAPWNELAAESVARELLAIADEYDLRLVLLGRKVQAAFKIREPGVTMTLGYVAGVKVALIPHPSGRCRVWNEDWAESAAESLVRELTRGQEVPCESRSRETATASKTRSSSPTGRSARSATRRCTSATCRSTSTTTT